MKYFIEKLVETNPLAGLSVLVTNNSENIFEFSYSNKNINNQENILTTSSKVRIASISKLVTTLGVMNLVNLEKLNLDADISEYLDFNLKNPLYPKQKITLRHLLSHTSSIVDGNNELYNAPLGTHIQEFFINKNTKYYENGSHFTNYEPGKQMVYSNLSFGVIATAIENVSGERFDSFMRNNIFLPLGITADYNVLELSKRPNTKITPLYKKLNKNNMLDKDGQWIAQVDTKDFIETLSSNNGYNIGTNGTLYAPQGGLRISTKDLSILIRCLINGGVPIIKRNLLEEMLKPAWNLNVKNNFNSEYKDNIRSTGLGTIIINGIKDDICNDKIWNSVSSKNWAGHYGEAYGLISRFIFNQKLRIGIITVCNGISSDENNNNLLKTWEEELFEKIAEKFLIK